MKKFFLLVLLFSVYSFPQEQRNVLVEIFTNSHCGNCPAAHNALSSYLASSTNAEHISYIYYHMQYPYSDDPLYQANTVDPTGRDQYYGPFFSTPRGFFDGSLQTSNYSGWSAALDQRAGAGSPLKINLSGTKEDNQLNINAEVIRSGDVAQDDLVIHFVIIENVNYTGRNGISNHPHVMRKMITSPTGESFSINAGETKNVEKVIPLSDSWIKDSLNVVVFVQSSGSKNVIQAGTISYQELSAATSAGENLSLPDKFYLGQNFPNPFNPSTKISFSLPVTSFVTLKVYNLLGKEIKTLVNKEVAAGSHEIDFNAEKLAGGVYMFKLSAGDFVQTKKMILLK